jgi:hypothetical protein
MRFSRLFFQQSYWRQRFSSEKLNDWFMNTPSGFRVRLALLTAPVVVYPVGAMLINGPFIDRTFKWRYDLDTELPSHLTEIIESEYEDWLEKTRRKKVDSVVKFYLQDKYVDVDSIVKGTMGTRAGGARIALPFNARFKSFDEAKEYCEKFLEPLKLLNSTACIIWDSKLGRDIIETFVLSEDAIRFIVRRDLMSCENYQALVNAPVVIASYTTFSSFFTYVIHKYGFKNFHAINSFVAVYTFLTGLAIFGALQYHKFFYYSTGYYSDEETSKRSVEHTNGGMEYYLKLLRRHRLLREVLDKGPDLFTPAGNLNGVGLNFVFRYGKLKEMIQENDEIAPAFEGDD